MGGQALCILIPLGYWLSVMDKGLGGAMSFLFIYFALGAWQAVSCVAWLIAKRGRTSFGRKIYLVSLGTLALMVLPQLGGGFERALPLILIGTGVLAIFYFVLSIAETLQEGRRLEKLG